MQQQHARARGFLHTLAGELHKPTYELKLDELAMHHHASPYFVPHCPRLTCNLSLWVANMEK